MVYNYLKFKKFGLPTWLVIDWFELCNAMLPPTFTSSHGTFNNRFEIKLCRCLKRAYKNIRDRTPNVINQFIMQILPNSSLM